MTILFEADYSALHDSFEAGFYKTQKQDINGSIVTSTTDPVPAYDHPVLGYCLDHTLDSNGYRVETYPQTAGQSIVDGDEIYFRFSFLLPSGAFPIDNGNYFLNINQIHSANGSASPPLEFDVFNGGLHTRGQSTADGSYNNIINKVTDVAYDTVYTIVYGLVVSATDTGNLINVWANGTKVITDLDPGYSLLDGGDSYWKGSTLYADSSIARPMTVYQRDHAVATTSADLLTVSGGGSGTFVDMPPDFAFVEVHVSDQSASFTPTSNTLVTRLTGESSAIATNLDYGSDYWARLVSVDFSGNKSAPSEAVQGTPKQVVNIDLGPDAVDTLQIRDAAIKTAKIDDLAVNDAKIGDLNVGKLTGGSLEAEIITANGAFRTGTDFYNSVSIDYQGIYAYETDASGNHNLKVWIKSSGDALFTGEIKTAFTGKRLEINNTNQTPSILFQSNGTTTSTAPAIYLAADNINASRPAIIVEGPEIGTTGYSHSIIIQESVAAFNVRSRGTNPASYEGLYISQSTGSVPQVLRCGGNGGEAWIRNSIDTEYNGLQLYRLTYTDGQLVPRGSSSHLKRGFQDMTALGIETLRNAPVYQYKTKLTKSEDDWISPIGPMADDLPDWMTQPASQNDPDPEVRDARTYDLHSWVAVIAQAVRDLDTELDAFRDSKPHRITDKEKKRSAQ